MSELRKNFTAFALLFAASLALAFGGVLWLGADGRLPVEIVQGDIVRTGSVWALFGPALIVLIIWGLLIPCGVALAAPLTASNPLDGDAARNLRRYLAALRIYAIGFSVLAILLQLFLLVRAAGVALPLGLDRQGAVRLSFLFSGLLFAFMGNLSPKVPHVARAKVQAPFSAAEHYKIGRFFGWVFVGGGCVIIALALAGSFETLTAAVPWILGGMIVLPMIRCLIGARASRRHSV